MEIKLTSFFVELDIHFSSVLLIQEINFVKANRSNFDFIIYWIITFTLIFNKYFVIIYKGGLE